MLHLKFGCENIKKNKMKIVKVQKNTQIAVNQTVI
jgi:hypothetical protein